MGVVYYPVVGLKDKMVYVFKLPAGSLRSELEAEEIATKAKSSLRGGDYVPEIVVMEGEPTQNPNLFGSYASVTYIRSILPTLKMDLWHQAELN
jgi:hypothetical protein